MLSTFSVQNKILPDPLTLGNGLIFSMVTVHCAVPFHKIWHTRQYLCIKDLRAGFRGGKDSDLP